MTDSPQQPTSGLLAHLATLAGADPETEPAQAAADILRRTRSAIAHHDGHPNGAWSMREQLAVALVLKDREHLAAMGYTPTEAARAVADGMYFPPADFTGWLDGIRDQLDASQEGQQR
jgi:hypothetical protein